MTDDLCYMSASEALALFKARKLSPVELMEAVIARAEVVEPKINAFTYTFYDRALELARKAEQRYAKEGARPRPLDKPFRVHCLRTAVLLEPVGCS